MKKKFKNNSGVKTQNSKDLNEDAKKIASKTEEVGDKKRSKFNLCSFFVFGILVALLAFFIALILIEANIRHSGFLSVKNNDPKSEDQIVEAKPTTLNESTYGKVQSDDPLKDEILPSMQREDATAKVKPERETKEKSKFESKVSDESSKESKKRKDVESSSSSSNLSVSSSIENPPTIDAKHVPINDTVLKVDDGLKPESQYPDHDKISQPADKHTKEIHLDDKSKKFKTDFSKADSKKSLSDLYLEVERLADDIQKKDPDNHMLKQLEPHLEGITKELEAGNTHGISESLQHIMLLLIDVKERLASGEIEAKHNETVDIKEMDSSNKKEIVDDPSLQHKDGIKRKLPNEGDSESIKKNKKINKSLDSHVDDSAAENMINQKKLEDIESQIIKNDVSSELHPHSEHPKDTKTDSKTDIKSDTGKKSRDEPSLSDLYVEVEKLADEIQNIDPENQLMKQLEPHLDGIVKQLDAGNSDGILNSLKRIKILLIDIKKRIEIESKNVGFGEKDSNKDGKRIPVDEVIPDPVYIAPLGETKLSEDINKKNMEPQSSQKNMEPQSSRKNMDPQSSQSSKKGDEVSAKIIADSNSKSKNFKSENSNDYENRENQLPEKNTKLSPNSPKTEEKKVSDFSSSNAANLKETNESHHTDDLKSQQKTKTSQPRNTREL